MKSERAQWLEDMSSEEDRVFQDELGEFIYQDYENGAPGEDGYEVGTRIVRIPSFIN